MRSSLPCLAKNAFEILSRLPRHGLGARLSRTTWADDSFWTVVEARLSPGSGGRHGDAAGVLTWRGEAQDGGRPRRIRGPLKRVWRLLGGAAADAGGGGGGGVAQRWPALAADALAAETRQREAAAAAAAAAGEGGGAAGEGPAAAAGEEPPSPPQ